MKYLILFVLNFFSFLNCNDPVQKIKKVTLINFLFFSLFMVAILTLFGCKKPLNNEVIEVKTINNFRIDTIFLLAANSKFVNPRTYKIVNNNYFMDTEVTSIGNIVDKKLYIFDFKERKLVKTIQLYSEGPNTTIYGGYNVYHHIINDNTIIIIDAPSGKISRINSEGIKLKSFDIPVVGNNSYGLFIDFMIQGVYANNLFLYPVAPWGVFPETVEDLNVLDLFHLLSIDFNKNHVNFKIKRSNLYTLDKLYYLENCCQTNFIANNRDVELFISDCFNPEISVYSLIGLNKKTNFIMKSNEFKNVPPYYKKFTSSEFSNLPAQSFREILEFGHKNPSYAQLHVDTFNNLIIRQAKLGMSEENYYEDRTKWAHSLILHDLTTLKFINELKINKDEHLDINFLDGFMTSEGLVFPFKVIQSKENEDILQFAKITFLPE
ncbi:MAG TPA: DUF4221 family protein [Saprospiraceae bacterium]|nr:DUF4221 family protein [Saprospiraceae bacterium]HNT21469.1 DUF4221 family protein [Saprospiraceae bacterium]